MKNFIKNNLKVFVSVIISGIVFTGIGVYAASQYFAKDITFTPTNENFKKENGEAINNVEDALNELYNKSNEKINGLGSIIKISNYQQTRNTYSSNISLEKGNYLCSTSYVDATHANVQGELKDSSRTVDIVGCDKINVLNKFGKSLSGKSSVATSVYEYFHLVGNLFSCQVNEDKNVTFTYGVAGNNSMTPLGFEASCVKINYE